MGQILNSFWPGESPARRKVAAATYEPLSPVGTARVIAGSTRRLGGNVKKSPQSVGHSEPRDSVRAHAGLSVANYHLPFLQNFSPATVLAAGPDLLLISASFVAVQMIMVHRVALPMLVFYLVAYGLVTTHGNFYDSWANRRNVLFPLVEALTAVTLLTMLALALSPTRKTAVPLLLWSALNWLALSVRYRINRSRHKTRAAARHVMIVGSAATGQALFDSLRAESAQRDVREFLLDRSLLEPHGAALMARIARQACIDEVIIATERPAILRTALREAKRNCLDAYVALDLSGAPAIACENVSGIPLLKVREQEFPEWALAGKRTIDVLLSAVALVALAPLMILTATAIATESRGSVFYRAERIGRKGRRFTCNKFRTMVQAADTMKPGLRVLNQRNGAFFKIANDPRTTRVGRFLRRYSLDELPQLWNVLRGDMSLVGPRPHPPDDVANYGLEDLRRLDFVPGITGLWQVTARQDPSFQRCVNLDVEYIESWSLSLDFKILCRTIGVVLQGTGT